LTAASVSITVGGAPGGTQFVKVTGNLVTVAAESTGHCPCNVRYYVTLDGQGQVGMTHYQTNAGDIANGLPWVESSPILAVVAVPTGSTQTFRLMTALDGSTTPNPGLYLQAQSSSLSALVVPFGASGAATLSPAGAGE
jgi:hypothetical protein